MVSSEGCDGLAVGEREDRAVEGVFEGDEGCRTMVNVVIQDGVFLDVFEGEVVAVLREDLDGKGVGEGGYSAGFPLVDVGAGVCEDGVRGLGHVCANAELVALGAGGDKEGGWETG